MSFYAPHLALAAILRQKVAALPTQAEDVHLVFGEFLCLPATSGMLGGPSYVKKVMDSLFGPNKKTLEVQLFNTLDPPGNYTLFVEFSGSSEEQFLGEHAGFDYQPSVGAKVFTSFTPRERLPTCTKTLVLPAALIDVGCIWPLQEAAVSTSVDCEKSFTIVSVIEKDGQVWVEMNRAVDASLLERQWVVRAPSFGRVQEYSATLDTVEMGVTLRTVGEIEVHLLLCMLTRWMLKSSRASLQLAVNNLQAASLTQGPPRLDDGGEAFVTTFTLRCRASDTWISARSTPPSFIGIKSTPERTEK